MIHILVDDDDLDRAQPKNEKKKKKNVVWGLFILSYLHTYMLIV